MSRLFLKVVSMSLSASWLIIAVLLIRPLVRRAPRWVSVLMWGVAASRLIFPFSVKSALSLIPGSGPISPRVVTAAVPRIHANVPAVNSAVDPVIGQTSAASAGGDALSFLIPVLAALWAAGAAGFLIYTAVTYLRLHRSVATAVRLRGNIYMSENVRSPFVAGILRPRIYLPFGMEGEDVEYVIAHERAHIRRGDHLWKPLGFALLAVHWFNPLVWLAYVLLCRDIELACDEKVIKGLENEQRAGYTKALLACSVGRRAAYPLAFGEVGVKERVRSVMNYKKPAFWIVSLSVALCAAVAVCFLTDPREPEGSGTSQPVLWEWFDRTDPTSEIKSDLTLELPPFPGVTFRCTGEGIIAVTGEGVRTPLIHGPLVNVVNAYFCDLTGDGVPELCATYEFGSGIVDSRVAVYDYKNGVRYEMADRWVYNYRLYQRDAVLCVEKRDFLGDTIVSSGPLIFDGESLGIGQTSGRSAEFPEAGTNYVSWQCLYTNLPTGAAGASNDSGYRYTVERDCFTVTALKKGASFPASGTVDEAAPRPRERIPVSRWDWRELPYTAEQWRELFKPQTGSPIEDIRALYGEILFMPLNDSRFLLLADGELLAAELAEGGESIRSIYSLIDEADMGVAQWEYAPELSSRQSSFMFRFDPAWAEVSASCAGGELSGPAQDGAGDPARDFYWSPVETEGSLAESAEIYLSCSLENGERFSGTVYITAGGVSSGRRVYTARLVGMGLHLSPMPESEGGVISPMETGGVTEHDLRNGSLELSPAELSEYVFFTNSEKIAVTVKGPEDFEGTVLLCDISQGGGPIRQSSVGAGKEKVIFNGLTSARLYRIETDNLEGCTVTVSQR